MNLFGRELICLGLEFIRLGLGVKRSALELMRLGMM